MIYQNNKIYLDGFQNKNNVNFIKKLDQARELDYYKSADSDKVKIIIEQKSCLIYPTNQIK